MDIIKSKKLSFLLSFLLISALVLAGVHTQGDIQVSAISHTNLTVKTTSYTSILLKWHGIKGAKGYKIYRNTSSGCKKLIKTIKSSKVRSYHDKKLKKNTYYGYEVRAYKYSKGKTKLIAPIISGEGVAGVSRVYIDRKYLDFDTTSRIGLAICNNHSFYYNIEIYRSTFRDTGYKKIDTAKNVDIEHNHGLFANYVDKDKSLKPNTSYYYKIRATSKIGKKALYGPMSNPVLHRTVNRTPVFNTTVLTPPETTTNELKVKIDSDNYNAPARMHTVRDLEVLFKTKDGQTSFDESFRIDRYSFDDVDYMQPGEYVSIPAGKTIYLYFKSNKSFSLPQPDDRKEFKIYYIDRDARYDIDSLNIDIIKNEVTRYTLDE